MILGVGYCNTFFCQVSQPLDARLLRAVRPSKLLVPPYHRPLKEMLAGSRACPTPITIWAAPQVQKPEVRQGAFCACRHAAGTRGDASHDNGLVDHTNPWRSSMPSICGGRQRSGRITCRAHARSQKAVGRNRFDGFLISGRRPHQLNFSPGQPLANHDCRGQCNRH